MMYIFGLLCFCRHIINFCMQTRGTKLRIYKDRIISRSILCSMDDFIQSKQVDKAVPFHGPLIRLK